MSALYFSVVISTKRVRRAVVYYAWAAQALIAGIECRHCISVLSSVQRESGARSCIMPGLPRHLLQEMNVGTVFQCCHRYNESQVRSRVLCLGCPGINCRN